VGFARGNSVATDLRGVLVLDELPVSAPTSTDCRTQDRRGIRPGSIRGHLPGPAAHRRAEGDPAAHAKYWYNAAECPLLGVDARRGSRT
jgi:hypothetical protein